MTGEIDDIRKQVADLRTRFPGTLCDNPQYSPNHVLEIAERVHAEALHPSSAESLRASGYMEGVNDAVDSIVSVIRESARYFGDDANHLALRIAEQLPGMKFKQEETP